MLPLGLEQGPVTSNPGKPGGQAVVAGGEVLLAQADLRAQPARPVRGVLHVKQPESFRWTWSELQAPPTAGTGVALPSEGGASGGGGGGGHAGRERTLDLAVVQRHVCLGVPPVDLTLSWRSCRPKRNLGLDAPQVEVQRQRSVAAKHIAGLVCRSWSPLTSSSRKWVKSLISISSLWMA